MNRSRLTNIILTTILVIGVAILVTQMQNAKEKRNEKGAEYETTVAEMKAGEKGAMDVIFSRKSVRHYTEQAVEADKLLALVKAGMAAPTAMNRQPWSFIIVTNMTSVAPISDKPGLMMLQKAKAVILVLGKKDEKFWQQDCSAATENILLAAEAMGLGAVWCAGYPLTDRTDSYKALFNYSDEYEVLSLISIGYPTGEDEPKDKYKEEKIHWNRW
ncbi:nitroreductase family protein [bacterium]|nr:nitroreductase family protein [bacterium]MBR6461708.1 nitroreductase family protein [bacterium]